MVSTKCDRIAEWFISNYKTWVKDNRLLSWSQTLGINLNKDGAIDNNQLFHLFVLAVLWNNGKTANAELGERIFEKIRSEYTLDNFAKAAENTSLADKLRNIDKDLTNPEVFNLLSYLASGKRHQIPVWQEIKNILNAPNIGDREYDIARLTTLYNIFNKPRNYGFAYLTVKAFLIFREIRIQFQRDHKYQYNPAICCIPDRHVRLALKELDMITNSDSKDIGSLITLGAIVAENFCLEKYELYDLPLFFWDKKHGPAV